MHKVNVDISNMDNEELEQYVRALEFLCGELDALLEVLPECPSHGRCVPYAKEWIVNQLKNQTFTNGYPDLRS